MPVVVPGPERPLVSAVHGLLFEHHWSQHRGMHIASLALAVVGWDTQRILLAGVSEATTPPATTGLSRAAMREMAMGVSRWVLAIEGVVAAVAFILTCLCIVGACPEEGCSMGVAGGRWTGSMPGWLMWDQRLVLAGPAILVYMGEVIISIGMICA